MKYLARCANRLVQLGSIHLLLAACGDAPESGAGPVGLTVSELEVARCPPRTNIIEGTVGDDTIYGTPGDDCILGGAGNDTLHGLGGDDVLSGGPGADQLYAGEGNDRLFGEEGSDYLYGDEGHDVLSGGAGGDECWGGPGDDVIAGDADNDILIGDSGSDAIADSSASFTFGGSDVDRCAGYSCELPAPVQNGCASNDACAFDEACVTDVGVCLPCGSLGTIGCNTDACPSDPDKVAPGLCGCDVPDTDSDGDGVADCIDACPADNPDDSDGDAVCNGVDQCPGWDDGEDTDDNDVPDGCQECFVDADCADECHTGTCSFAGECALAPLPAPSVWLNGDFASGTLDGFTTYATANGNAQVSIQTFGTASAAAPSYAARLVVGELVSKPSGTEGGGIYQDVELIAGALDVSVSIAAHAHAGSNGDAGILELYVDDVLLDQHVFGALVLGYVRRATLSGSIAAVAAGTHRIRVEARRSAPAGAIRNYVDDVVLSGSAVSPGTPCAGGLGMCDGAGSCDACPDEDGDLVCDEDDLCPGFDDHVDADENGIPDGCESADGGVP